MSNTIDRWALVEKEDLFDIFFGELHPFSAEFHQFPEAELRLGKMALGYLDHSSHRSLSHPRLLVIEDNFLNETMSWLKTFSEEIFPISQFLRISTRSDYIQFQTLRKSPSRPHLHRWASLSVGETLSNFEGESELKNMPLSRLSSSFSLPAGRTSLKFGSDECTRTCAERLRLVESDQRFGKRAISIKQLLPLWAMASSEMSESAQPEDAAHLVLSAYAQSSGSHHIADISPNPLKIFSDFKSDSVEERVHAFNRLSAEFLSFTDSEHLNSFAPSLAAAAFLVGRSTSHAFLLNKFGRRAPIMFAWFGLIAGISGPRFWDSAWLRATLGAEKLLHHDFSWGEVSSADITWPEFFWINRMFEGVGQLDNLPRMLPRTLAVEIVPGALMHMRFGSNSEVERNAASLTTPREDALQAALNEILSVAHKFGFLAKTSSSKSLPVKQQSLDLERHPSPSKSTRRPRQKKLSEF